MLVLLLHIFCCYNYFSLRIVQYLDNEPHNQCTVFSTNQHLCTAKVEDVYPSTVIIVCYFLTTVIPNTVFFPWYLLLGAKELDNGRNQTSSTLGVASSNH